MYIVNGKTGMPHDPLWLVIIFIIMLILFGGFIIAGIISKI